jgi:hypothetical protein
MTIPAHPLAWPTGWKRTKPVLRTRAKFGKAGKARPGGGWDYGRQLTIAEAVERVRGELKMMGIDADDLVISTNLQLRLDGFPRSNQPEPADPGVAVYWTDAAMPGNPPRCMAIDRYDRVADNLAAVAATLEAMRKIERHGGASILERAFAGFTALAGPAAEDWRAVLDPNNPEGSYLRLRSKHHPDRPGGDAAEFLRVQRAFDQYRNEAD